MSPKNQEQSPEKHGTLLLDACRPKKGPASNETSIPFPRWVRDLATGFFLGALCRGASPG